jgi:hypothetical protein
VVKNIFKELEENQIIIPAGYGEGMHPDEFENELKRFLKLGYFPESEKLLYSRKAAYAGAQNGMTEELKELKSLKWIDEYGEDGSDIYTYIIEISKEELVELEKIVNKYDGVEIG